MESLPCTDHPWQSPLRLQSCPKARGCNGKKVRDAPSDSVIHGKGRRIRRRSSVRHYLARVSPFTAVSACGDQAGSSKETWPACKRCRHSDAEQLESPRTIRRRCKSTMKGNGNIDSVRPIQRWHDHSQLFCRLRARLNPALLGKVIENMMRAVIADCHRRLALALTCLGHHLLHNFHRAAARPSHNQILFSSPTACPRPSGHSSRQALSLADSLSWDLSNVIFLGYVAGCSKIAA